MYNSKGYRMIEGKAFLLNGTVGGWTPEETQEKLRAEKKLKESQGLIVRFIKQSSFVNSMSGRAYWLSVVALMGFSSVFWGTVFRLLGISVSDCWIFVLMADAIVLTCYLLILKWLFFSPDRRFSHRPQVLVTTGATAFGGSAPTHRKA